MIVTNAFVILCVISQIIQGSANVKVYNSGFLSILKPERRARVKKSLMSGCWKTKHENNCAQNLN